jgi:hypothetical protein
MTGKPQPETAVSETPSAAESVAERRVSATERLDIEFNFLTEKNLDRLPGFHDALAFQLWSLLCPHNAGGWREAPLRPRRRDLRIAAQHATAQRRQYIVAGKAAFEQLGRRHEDRCRLAAE